MKENSIKNEQSSIEENIRILESIIKINNDYLQGVENQTINQKEIKALEHILSDYKRVLEINEVLLKENEELKEYIAIAPNLDEMTATKYRNIQQDAYIQGRAEEQQKAEQIIYENYIPIQKIKDKIEEYKNMLKTCNKVKDIDRIKAINERILELQELEECLRYQGFKEEKRRTNI